MPLPPFRRAARPWLLFLIVIHAAATPALPGPRLTRLLGTGDPVPGLPGITIDSFRHPACIDNDGNIGVVAVLEGPGVNPLNNRALLTGAPGNYSVLLRQRSPAPGLEPDTVRFLVEKTAMALSGHVAYSAPLESGYFGIFSGRPDDFQSILTSGDPPPGINDPDLYLLAGGYGLYVGPAGHVAFGENLGGPGVDTTNNSAFWTQLEPGGPLSLVSREGDQAPGYAPGVVRVGDQPLGGRPNARGEVTFTHFLDGPGIDSTNNQAIWSGRPGEVTVRVRKGDPAPQAGAGVSFNGFFGFMEQGPDAIVFDSVLTGIGVNSTNDRAVWTESGGSIDLVAREGQQAPGLGANQVFDSFWPYQFNEAGALISSHVRGDGIDGSNDQGVWLSRNGTLELLVWDGDPPVIDDPGVTLDHVLAVPSVTMNARGDVVLAARLVGPGLDDSNNRAVWARGYDSDDWFIVGRSGDVLDGRVIAGINYDDVLGEGGMGLNDNGELLVGIVFTDGTSAQYMVRIPAPASAFILALERH